MIWESSIIDFAWVSLIIVCIISVVGWVFLASEYLRFCAIVSYIGWFILSLKLANDSTDKEGA